MNVKKSLESRIRGWFPQEPSRISMSCKVEFEAKNPPPMIRSDFTLSATKFAGALTIFYIIFYGFIDFSFPSLERYTISAFQVLAWIIVGVAIGIVSMVVYTRNELCRLSRDYQTSVNWKELILILLVPGLVISFGGWYIFGSSLAVIITVYVWGVSISLTRYGLLYFYEKTENMRIMTGWFGGGFAIIPKAPNNVATVYENS